MKLSAKIFSLVLSVVLIAGVVPFGTVTAIGTNCVFSTVSDNLEEIPESKNGINLLNGIIPSSYGEKCGKPQATYPAGDIETFTDGIPNRTSGTHFSCIKFFEDDGAGNVRYLGDTGDTFVQIQYNLPETVSAEQFYIEHHYNDDLRTYHYQIFASENPKTLFDPENVVIDFCNKNADQRQVFKLVGGKLNLNCVGLRVLDPTFCNNADRGEIINNNMYFRLFEFGLNGDTPENTEYKNYYFKGDFDNTAALLIPENNTVCEPLSGKLPTSVTYAKNGRNISADSTELARMSAITDSSATTNYTFSDLDFYDYDGNAYIDIMYDLAQNTRISKINVIGGASKLGAYRVYIGNDKSNLFDDVNIKYYCTNNGKTLRQVITPDNGTYTEGRYVGLRILSPASVTSAKSYASLAALQVFGEQKQAFIDRTSKTTVSVSDGAPDYEKIFSAGISSGDGYCDFTTQLSSYYNISDLVFAFGNNTAVSRWEVYVSNNKTVISPQNLVAKFSDKSKKYCTVSSDENFDLNGRYIGVRAYGISSAASLADFGFSSFGINGTPLCGSYTVIADDSTEMLSRTDNMLKGILPTSVGFTAVNFPYTTVAPLSNGLEALTDENTANETRWSDAVFGANDGSKDYYYQNGEYYFDITFDLGEAASVEKLLLINHSNELYRTAHYSVYLGYDCDELFADKNLIADYFNDTHNIRQIFSGYESGRYIGIRIIDPCATHSSLKYNYPRIWEIAAYGTKISNKKLLFDGYPVKDDVVYGLLPGTTARTLLRKCVTKSSEVYNVTQTVSISSPLCTGMTVKAGNQSVAVAVDGDVDSNGVSSVTDIVLLCDGIISGTEQDKTFRTAADLNRDGVLNVTDITGMTDLIFKGEKPQNIPADTKFNPYIGLHGDGLYARRVDIDLDTVVSKNFIGFGGDTFPSNLTPESKLKTGYNQVVDELTEKRYASLTPNYTRMWFQIDWMITNSYDDYIYKDIKDFGKNSDISKYNTFDEETGEWVYHPKGNSDVSVKIADNKDYKNYKNGIYALDSEEMQSVYDHIELLKNADTEVCLNFGWKSATRIQSWFNAYFDTDPTHKILSDNVSRNSAPRELKPFAAACAAALDYIISEKGLTNVKAVSFYNEPAQNDFQLPDDFEVSEAVWWSMMFKECHDALNKKGLLQKVRMTATEDSHPTIGNRGYATYLHDNYGSIVDAYAFHYYFYDDSPRDYYYLRNLFTSYREFFGDKPIYITESYGKQFNNYSSDDIWLNWSRTNAALFIGSANVGVKACLVWTMCGGYLTDPSGWNLGSGVCGTWEIPTSEAASKKVYTQFYEESLYTNYVPRGSDVISVEWIGEDIRATAFRLPDGNYTVVIEADGTNKMVEKNSGGEYTYNKNYSTRALKLCFNRNLGKPIYKFTYDPTEINDSIISNTAVNSNATVLHNYKKFNVSGNLLSDTISGNYAVYVYTTKQPIKQVEMTTPVWQNISKGQSVTLSAKLIDCAANDEIVWSISECTASATKGSISATSGSSITYTASKSAQSGSMIAVRASLKSNPDRTFAVTILKIK